MEGFTKAKEDRDILISLLLKIRELDTEIVRGGDGPRLTRLYFERGCEVVKALAAARQYGLFCGIQIDPKEPEWPVIFIDLPTGQVSWHIEQYGKEWDGHTTEEKYQRVADYLDQCV